MTDFPTLWYVATSEIPTLSFTWSLKKVPRSGGASRIGHHREYPPAEVDKFLVVSIVGNVVLCYPVVIEPNVALQFSFFCFWILLNGRSSRPQLDKTKLEKKKIGGSIVLGKYKYKNKKITHQLQTSLLFHFLRQRNFNSPICTSPIMHLIFRFPPL